MVRSCRVDAHTIVSRGSNDVRHLDERQRKYDGGERLNDGAEFQRAPNSKGREMPRSAEFQTARNPEEREIPRGATNRGRNGFEAQLTDGAGARGAAADAPRVPERAVWPLRPQSVAPSISCALNQLRPQSVAPSVCCAR